MKSASQDVEVSVGFNGGAEALSRNPHDDPHTKSWPTTSARAVPGLIAESFDASPYMDAIEFQGASLSRGELTRRSDRVAFWLLKNAAGPGCLVGIFMDRSIEMLVGVLGVMKAGAAYVPLDPAFPVARNEQILGDTGVPVLLTLRRHLEELPKSDARIFCLDGDRPEWDIEPAALDVLPEVLPEMRAYVIFTSGSTGRPKGVEVTHGSVVNLLMSAGCLLEAGANDRLVAVTTLAFDISVLELLLPLVCGGTIVMASKEEASDALRLKELLKSSRATMLEATPVTFRSLLELGFEPPAGFKMMCGGEAWTPAMADKLLRTGGRLWNMYGPTETTVWSSIVEVHPGAERVTFGPPIAATRFYVLNADMRLVPTGKEGELWIAGAGVARGYLNRPELTAERFVMDPLVPGERMYRTGDEVRRREDGTIEFIGRLDHQIKLRGFRIELGEIEARMLAIAGIRDAAVVLRKDAAGEDFLLAFYTGSDGIVESELREILARQLPSYMLPKGFARLKTWPLTPNAKTDRRALMGMEVASESIVDSFRRLELVSPLPDGEAHGIEHRMLPIWQRLFPGAVIRDESSFFDLGGDSLLLVRLQSRIATEFDLRLTMADVTRHDTYGSLVDWAKESLASGESRSEAQRLDPAVLPLQTRGTGAPIFVIPQMLIFRILAQEMGEEQPFYGLQFPDDQVPDELAAASFEELADLYYRRIRQLQPKGPYRLAGWCLWGWMAYAIARRLEDEGEEVEMLAIIDAWAPGYWKRYSPVTQFFVNAGHLWKRLRWYRQSMKNIPVQRRVTDGLRRLRQMFTNLLRALPRGLRPEIEEVAVLRIQRFATTAAESYRPGPVKANVIVFKSELRPTGSFVGEDMGWSAILGRKVRLDPLPGNHNELFHLPAARIMAARMRTALGLPVAHPDSKQKQE